MKYTVKCSCGHEVDVSLFGKESDRQYKLKAIEENLCPDCAKALVDKRNEKAGLPPLRGSEKQIAWAGEIRLKKLPSVMDGLNTFPQKYVEAMKTKYSVQMCDVKSWVSTNDSAHWWIEHQYSDVGEIVIEVVKILSKMVQSAHELPAKQAAVKESTVQPQNKTHDVVPEIRVADSEVSVISSRDEDLRQILRNHGFVWKDHVWSFSITLFEGNVADRAAEIGSVLLNNGFAVTIYDDSVRENAVSANYAPRQRRWIAYNVKCRMLSIHFERGAEDVYAAARRICGSKWSAPDVLVPVNQADSVCDFAELYGFEFTPGAEREISDYRRSVAIVEPAAVNTVSAPDGDKALKDVLSSSPEVLEDLKDK